MLKRAWARLREADAARYSGYSSGLVETLAGSGPGEPVAVAHVEVHPEGWTTASGKSCKSMHWPEDDH